MPFYTGSTADGSDMRPVQGMYISPDGKEWSNMPYTAEQHEDNREYRRQERIWNEIIEHINMKRTLREEYTLIIEGKSSMSARCRKFLREWFENDKDKTE